MAAEAGYQIVPEEPRLTRRKPLPGGDFLPLRLDWILLRGLSAEESRMISTAREDLTYARPGSALAAFTGAELSDHNAVWGLDMVPAGLNSLLRLYSSETAFQITTAFPVHPVL